MNAARLARASTPSGPSAEAAARATTPARSLIRSATIIGLAFVASRILGLAREVILAREFGTSGEYDAYVSAFRVPDLLFLIVMAGSFGSAFIPVFAGFLGRGEHVRAWRLASVVLNLSALTMLGAALVAFVFAGPLVRWVVAPGLDAEYRAIATETMRILLLSPIFLGLGIAAKGILEAQDRFTLPALAPVLYNLAIIGGALLLAPSLGVYGVAWGVAVGAVGHLLVQVPGLIRSGMRYRPVLDLRVEGLREVGRLLLPRLIGQAAFQVNFIVVNAFASHAGEGRVSALNYAWQLMMLPHGVLALSISTVIFPTMARLFDQGRIEELRATFAGAVRPLLFLTLPASIGLFLFRTPIVQTVLQFGEFDERSTRLATAPLAFLAPGLAGYALAEVLTRAFYAMHDTRTPVVAGVGTIVLNVLLSAALVGPFGHAALAFSLSLTTGVEALVLLMVLERRLGGSLSTFADWFGRVATASAVMALVAFAMQVPLERATEPENGPRLVQIALLLYAVGVAAFAYVVSARLLAVPEVERMLGGVAARVPLVGRLLYPARGRR